MRQTFQHRRTAMPKFLVSIARDVAKREVLEVSADSPEEARWIALSSCDAWMDVESSAVIVTSAAPLDDRKSSALRTAA
jgi:hypothetical protein